MEEASKTLDKTASRMASSPEIYSFLEKQMFLRTIFSKSTTLHNYEAQIKAFIASIPSYSQISNQSGIFQHPPIIRYILAPTSPN